MSFVQTGKGETSIGQFFRRKEHTLNHEPTIFAPNVRYHRCEDCLIIFECDSCTASMRRSQRRAKSTRKGSADTAAVYVGRGPHRFFCEDCKGQQRKRA